MILISAISYKNAEFAANLLKLKPTEWRHIPLLPVEERLRALRGRRVLSDDDLIGYFTPKEKRYLKGDHNE